ncbi:hypothetical protein CSC12_3726 [Klebsiella michiganensis]|nr:hypothetical protein CSC12_3726 [Klebsiella michiganensis]
MQNCKYREKSAIKACIRSHNKHFSRNRINSVHKTQFFIRLIFNIKTRYSF